MGTGSGQQGVVNEREQNPPASAATLTGGGGNRGSFQAGHHDNPISTAGRQRMGKDTTSYLRERMPAGELQQMVKNGVSTEEIVAAVERIEARGGDRGCHSGGWVQSRP